MPAPPRLGGYPLQDAWCWVWLLLGGVCGGGGLSWLHVLLYILLFFLVLVFCVVDMCDDTIFEG